MIFARRRSSCGIQAAGRTEDFERRAIVDVFVPRERLDQRLVTGHVRQHAQLDLRVVHRDQHVTRLGDERAPDFAAQLGANRNVLQVGIAAAQASRGGHRLVEAGVHATRGRVHELRQRVDVGALQLHQRAPLEHQSRQSRAQGRAPRALRTPSNAPSSSTCAAASPSSARACRRGSRRASWAS